MKRASPRRPSCRPRRAASVAARRGRRGDGSRLTRRRLRLSGVTSLAGSKEIPMLNIPLAKLSHIITKARDYDAKVESEPGSDPSEDGDGAIVSDYADDPTGEELSEAIASLNEDERDEVVALLWIGRGDFDKEEWAQALAQAHSELDRPAAEYLMG